MPVLPAPAAPTHDLGGARFTSLATPTSGSTDTSVWLVEIDAGTPATPHELTREEVFVVLAGRAAVRIGDRDQEAGRRRRDRRARRGAVRARARGRRAAARAVLPAGRRPGPDAGRGAVHATLGGMSTPLARLLAMAYRLLIDDLHRELAARGWTDVREAFGFVLLALRGGPISLRELVATLGTSKQAVSKLVDAMVGVGLVERVADPHDARAKDLQLTGRGRALLADVEEIYGELEAGWARTLGPAGVGDLRRDLETVVRAAHGGALPPVRPTA